MPETIPFPGAVTAVGETFPAEAIRAGRTEAARRGIAGDQVDAVTAHDRRFALYLLGNLGSQDPYHQRCGEVGLRRLLDSIEAVA